MAGIHLNAKLNYNKVKKSKCLSFSIIVTIAISFTAMVAINSSLKVITIGNYQSRARYDGDVDITITPTEFDDTLNYTVVTNIIQGLVEQQPAPEITFGYEFFPGVFKLEDFQNWFKGEEEGDLAEYSGEGVSCVLVDFDLQSKIGVRENEVITPGKGEVIVESRAALDMNVTVGDTFYVRPQGIHQRFMEGLAVMGVENLTPKDMVMPVRVVQVLQYAPAKISDNSNRFNRILMDLDAFYTHYREYLSKFYTEEEYKAQKTNLDMINPRDYSSRIKIKRRSNEFYLNPNPKEILRELLPQVSRIKTALGDYPVRVRTDLAIEIESLSKETSPYRILLKFIMAVTAFLTSYIIYNIMVVKYQTDVYLCAVLRTIGYSRPGLIWFYMSNCLIHSVVGVLFGLVGSKMFMANLAKMFKQSGIILVGRLETASLMIALGCSVFIPMISALGPILSIMDKSISSSLDKSLSKSKGVKISVGGGGRLFDWGHLVWGFNSASIGLFIYTLMPYSLLSSNAGIFSLVMLVLILCLLTGTTLILMNFSRVFEKIFARILMVFEGCYVKTLTKMNLDSHRESNRRTVLVYSLSLTLLMFIYSLVSIQINGQLQRILQDSGSKFVVSFREDVVFTIQDWKDFLKENEDFNEYNYAFIYKDLPVFMSDGAYGEYKLKNRGKIREGENGIRAVSDNFFEVTSPDSSHYYGKNTTLSQALYSRGFAGGMVISKNMEKYFELDCQDPKQSRFIIELKQRGKTVTKDIDCLESLESANGVKMSSQPMQLESSEAIMDIYSYLSLAAIDSHRTVFDTLISKVLIQIDEAEVRQDLNDRFATFYSRRRSKETTQKILGKYDSAEYDIYDYEKEKKSIQGFNLMFDLVVKIVTVIIFVVGYFSLISTMVTNKANQKVEIGILRTMGVTVCGLSKVYFYECLVMVSVAIFIGSVNGTAISWIYLQQINVISGAEMSISTPYDLISMMFGFGFVSSFFAGMLSSYFSLKIGIVSLIRGN